MQNKNPLKILKNFIAKICSKTAAATDSAAFNADTAVDSAAANAADRADATTAAKTDSAGAAITGRADVGTVAIAATKTDGTDGTDSTVAAITDSAADVDAVGKIVDVEAGSKSLSGRLPISPSRGGVSADAGAGAVDAATATARTSAVAAPRRFRRPKSATVWAFAAIFCLLLTSVLAAAKVKNLALEVATETARRAAIADAKRAIDELYARIKEPLPSGAPVSEALRRQRASAMIAALNRNGLRLYALSREGVYLAHYNQHFLGANAFAEVDVAGRFYMRELRAKALKNGCFTEARIPWGSRLREIVTYAMADERIDVIYGCTVDLSGAIERERARGHEGAVAVLIIFAAMGVCALIWQFWRCEIARQNRRESARS